ncbi:MAG TPA: aldo/keto reductase [Thermodesulfobacteriota bacterium]|nr:aldo/keto reductase [Thermodesulfobacteriota bacterium]
MEYKKLGKTKLEVSRIGFGCWAIGGHGYGTVNDYESISAIKKAMDLGINFFDTADVYGFGHSEMILGKALGDRRKDVIIGTKFGVRWDENGRTYRDCSAKSVCEALEGSLRRLGVDCIPLYQIHWHDGRTPIGETIEALQKCRIAGKIKYFGCSNVPLELIKEINKFEGFVSVQLLYNMAHRENERLIQECHEVLGIGTLVYGVLMRGFFSGKYNGQINWGDNDTRAKEDDFRGKRLSQNLVIVQNLKKEAKCYNRLPVQIAVRWVLDHSFVTCAIVGAKNEDQITENVGAIGWALDKKFRLSEIS